MPVLTLTDAQADAAKQVTYLGASLKGFGVRVGAEPINCQC
jgi:hypothetical protein